MFTWKHVGIYEIHYVVAPFLTLGSILYHPYRKIYISNERVQEPLRNKFMSTPLMGNIGKAR